MKITKFFLAIAFIASGAAHAASSTPEILVTALRGMQWQVRYDFAQPVDKLAFKFSPDDSRGRTWLPDQGFEIVTADGGEIARRKDGAPFRTVRFRMSPTYSYLPKEYAPFSPFGDGGMLFHTGRFFACQNRCPDDASWSMDLWAANEDQIILNGKVVKAQAHWTDKDDGRSIYIGKNAPQQTADFIAVLDTALPERIRAQLLEQLPELMHLFAGKLGALTTRPMLFVSYDVSHPKGWGRQGGVLPGQVFIHFYGSKWPAEMEKPGFADDLAWHFAHESAHMYQRSTSTTKGDDWITEGGAEAFAAIALRADAAAYVKANEEKAVGECREFLKGRSVHDAIVAGTFDAAYSCGMLINLAIDSKIRLATKHDGLYAVWRDYLKRADNKGSAVAGAAYLEAVADVGGADIAEWVQKAVAEEGASLILARTN
jgi:hypothetical protein